MILYSFKVVRLAAELMLTLLAVAAGYEVFTTASPTSFDYVKKGLGLALLAIGFRTCRIKSKNAIICICICERYRSHIYLQIK